MRGIPSMRALQFCLKESRKNEARRLELIKQSDPHFSFHFWEDRPVPYQDRVSISLYKGRF